MALRVINHYPPINEVDVARNASIEIQFNKGILPGSLDYTHFSLNDSHSYTTIPGVLGVVYNASGISNIVRFSPSINMTANTGYKFYVFGRPNSVLSTDNEQLETTYSFGFTTGTNVYITNSGLVDSGVIDDSISSGVFSTTNILYITETDPVNKQGDVATNIGYVYIKFNGDISTTGPELSGYISVTAEDVLK